MFLLIVLEFQHWHMNKLGLACREWEMRAPFTLVTLVDSQATVRHVCEALLDQPAPGQPQMQPSQGQPGTAHIDRNTPTDLQTQEQ